MIYHFTPFFRGNISEGINRSVEAVPEDAWVCIRDADTMFLTWRQQWQLERISQTTEFGLIGCMTNRCYPVHEMHGGQLSNEYDLLHHIEVAKALERDHWCEVKPVPDESPEGLANGEGLIWGHLMMFPKRVWREAGGFSGHTNHDIGFSRSVAGAGHRIGVASGVYIFHAFRPGMPNPFGRGKFDPGPLDP